MTVTVTLRNEGCVALGLPQYRLQVRSLEPGSFLEPSDPEPIVHYLAVGPGQSDAADFLLRAADQSLAAPSPATKCQGRLLLR